MEHHALVIEDDTDIAETVAESLSSMGHRHDWVKSQEEARARLPTGGYSYVLLDLQIPVRAGGGLPCIEYGEQLAKEIHRAPRMHHAPIIVMTAYGKEGLEVAASLCEHGVVDFINKPFPRSGRTLGCVIRTALERREQRLDAAIEQPPDPRELVAFAGGDLVVGHDAVELCGVRVLTRARSGQMWDILSVLRKKAASGRYCPIDGGTLARAIGCQGGQGSIAGSVRDFRRHASTLLARELNQRVGPRDVIDSGGTGYRLQEWIKDCESSGATSGSVGRPDATAADDVEQYLLSELRKGRQLRAPDVARAIGCSLSKVKRALGRMGESGLIGFVGPSRTGHYVLHIPLAPNDCRRAASLGLSAAQPDRAAGDIAHHRNANAAVGR